MKSLYREIKYDIWKQVKDKAVPVSHEMWDQVWFGVWSPVLNSSTGQFIAIREEAGVMCDKSER